MDVRFANSDLRLKRKCRGYSFPEVLFAVVVLGIGFIMIAAIFPVAIAQSKATQDEVAAAAIARSGVSIMTDLVYDPRDPAALTPPLPVPPGLPDLFINTVSSTANPPYNYDPATGDQNITASGHVLPAMTLGAWRAMRGNMIFRDDPRYAFVPLYRRGNTAGIGVPGANGTLQLYIIGVQCRSALRSAPPRADAVFDFSDVGLATAPNQATPTIPELEDLLTQNPNNLRPRRVLIFLRDNELGDGIDLLHVNPTPDATDLDSENLPDAVAEGAYVITSVTGRIYRVGAPRPDLGTVPGTGHPAVWELQAGNDMRDQNENEPPGTGPLSGPPDRPAWCVGRERQPDGTFIGGAQDISIYTALVSVRP